MPPSGSRHAAQSRTISCQAGAITSRGLSPGHGSPATSQSEPSSGLSPPSKAPAIDGLGEAAEQGAEFRLYDTDESAKPAGEFLARFSMLAIAPLGTPFIP
jgi:hypothetical protein